MRHAILWPLIIAISMGTILAPSDSDAALLPIGTFQSPLALETGPSLATLVAGGDSVPFVSSGFSGGLVSSVYTHDVTNPFGADKLTFTYELSNRSVSPQALNRLAIAGFADSLADVSFAPLATATVNRSLFFFPSTAEHHASASFADRVTADLIGFSFVDALGQGGLRRGDYSPRLVVQTNATTFTTTTASVIGGTSVSVRSFAPGATALQPVPEPSALVLAAGGALAFEAVCVIRRFRRRSLT
jgi:hypothetical protein